MFSISTAPPKQSAGETIAVLSGRLNSSTLLEDRRAAILGLRSFAKDFPASVASGSLRSLIASLSKDGEDADTVKVVLETLLMLFSPNETSPEASDEVALWLADEFTQRQENITLLLDFLDSADFFSKLYSLQLLIAILAARPERTEECIFTAPLGISRLVAVLENSTEATRGEAITLLTYLTPKSPDLQKLVAFENAYERLFTIIVNEGGLTNGGRIVEDCLILLSNLLRQNPSNQTLFRESGFISRLAHLLETSAQQVNDTELASWVLNQRNRNLYALLAVVRLFLVPGAVGTNHNQVAFQQHGLLNSALQLSFAPSTEAQIKSEAMVTCADIIRGNAHIQEGFAQLMVPNPFAPTLATDGSAQREKITVYVVDGLLDLTLGLSSLQDFDLRFSACECLKAYFFTHSKIRSHFLGRAIQGHKSGHDETANVLSVLLHPSPDLVASDPYRLWFAATIVFHLLYNNPLARSQAMELTEGVAEEGEEVVTAIQTIAARLISGLNRSEEPRHLTAYFMLLIVWLYEDLDSVNDFLNEGSNVQGLIQAVIQPRGVDEIVQGLCAMLLGVIYEFSTKDSPLPRTSLHELLLRRMGLEKFSDRLARLRSHPFMRDYEVIPQKIDPSSGLLPDVFFDRTFVEFFKDTYSRISRSLERDPNLEVSVISNGVQKGISRELVDSLRADLADKQKQLEDSWDKLAMMESALQKEQAEHRKTRDTSSVEVTRIKTVNEALQRQKDMEIQKLTHQHESDLQTEKQKLVQVQRDFDIKVRIVASENLTQLAGAKRHIEELERQREADQRRWIAIQEDLTQKLTKLQVESESELDRVKGRLEAHVAELEAARGRFEADLLKVQQARAQEVKQLIQKHEEEMRNEHLRSEKLQSQIEEAETLITRHQEELTQNKVFQQELDLAKAEVQHLQTGLQKSMDENKSLTEQISQQQRSLNEVIIASEKSEQDASTLRDELAEAKSSIKRLTAGLSEANEAAQSSNESASEIEALNKKASEIQQKLDDALRKLEDSQFKQKVLQDLKNEIQTELEDSLMLCADMEEKLTTYKKRLKVLGEQVSDGEEDNEADEDDD